MSFDYEIKADPSQALAANKKVEDSLTGIEQKATHVGQTMGEKLAPTGLKDTEGRFQATAVAAQQLKTRVADLTDQWEREDDLLERIRGPQREYEADMRALNSLYSESTISAEEYDSQVKKLQTDLERSKGSGEEGHGGLKLDEVMGAAKGAVASLGIIEVAKQIGELIEASEKLDDAFTEIENRALKFVDAGHSMNFVLAEQTKLAADLHSTLGPTMDLYDAVGDALAEMNLSQTEQVRLTKSLGEAAEIAGRPLSSAEGIIAKIAVAMESGTGAGKAMQTVIKQFPELADTWAEAFNVDRQGLIKLAQDGKLSLDQLMIAATQHTEHLDEMFKKRKKTNEEERAEIQQNFTVLRQSMSDSQALLEAVSPAYHEMGEQIRDLQDPSRAAARTIDQVKASIQDTIDIAKRGADEFKKAVGQEMADAIIVATDKIREFGNIAKVAFGNDVWGDEHARTGLLSFFPVGTEAAMKYAAGIGTARRDLVELNAAHAAGAIRGEAYQKQYESLVTTLNNGQLPSAIKIWHQLHDGADMFHRDMDALDAMWRAGKVSVDEYREELAKIAAEDPGLKAFEEQVKSATEAFVKQTNNMREAAEHGITLPSATGLTGYEFRDAERQALEDLATAKKEDLELSKEMEEEERKGLEIVNARMELLKATASPAEKLHDDIEKLNKAFAEGSGGVQADYDRIMADLKSKFFDTTPEQKYKKALEDLDLIAKELKPSTEELARAQDELAKRFGQPRSMTAGLQDGWADVKKQMLDVAGPAQQLVSDAFKNIEGSILELVNTGEMNWRKMIDSMLDDLARLALRMLEMQLITSISGSAPVPGELPGHASGGSWVVGGSGGADSTLQAFYATPGERVTVETPAQQAAARYAGGGAGGGVQAVAHFHLDPRELLAAGDSPAGERQTLQVIRRNPGAIRSWLGGGARR